MNQKNFALLILAFTGWLYLNSCNASNLQNTSNKPTPEVIPGWTEHEIENVSFQLPDTYQDDTEWYKENFPDYAQKTIYLATITDKSSNTIISVYSLAKIEITERIIFSEFVDSYIEQINADYDTIARKEIDADFPTEKIISTSENRYGKNVGITYLTFVGNFIYRIEFQCVESDYEQYADEFEKIYKTVIIRREDYSNSLTENYQGIICVGIVLLVIALIILNAWLKRRRRTNDITPIILPEDF